MELLLTELTNLTHYTGKPFPKWGRFLAPDAAQSLLKLEMDTGGLSYTDIWRPAEISLHAMAEKRGVQPPGYSAHNYGLAFDLDIEGTLKQHNWKYEHILGLFEAYGWHCHRRDERGGSEAWHFNFLGVGKAAEKYLSLANKQVPKTWAKPVEALIVERYGPQLQLNSLAIQTELQKLKMYNATLDGRLGPLTKQAIIVFQKAWGLEPTGLADVQLRRTLAFVTASKKLVPASENGAWNAKTPVS